MYLRLSCKPRIQRMNFPNDYFPWAQRIYWAYQKKGIQILWLRKVQILGNTETHYDKSFHKPNNSIKGLIGSIP